MNTMSFYKFRSEQTQALEVTFFRKTNHIFQQYIKNLSQ